MADDILQLEPGMHMVVQKDYVLKVVPRKRAVHYYYAVFAESDFTEKFPELSPTAQKIFLYMASTLTEHAGSCADFTTLRASVALDIKVHTLYCMVNQLKNKGFIKKWKSGISILNPHYVWAYDQQWLSQARILWNNWEATEPEERDKQLAVYSKKVTV